MEKLDHEGMAVASVEAEGEKVQKGRSPSVNAERLHGVEKLRDTGRPADKPLQGPREWGVYGTWDENSHLRWSGQIP